MRTRPQQYSYTEVKGMLSPQMRKCRDKAIRCKVELLLYGLKLKDVSLACQRLGFGRASYYKWWNRLLKRKFKIEGLKEHSRRPRRSPAALDEPTERRIRYYRRKGFGAEMTREYLAREGYRSIAASTIQHVFNDRKPPKQAGRKVKLKKHRKRYELPVPGQRLQMDVKYSPMQVGGQTVYIYVAVDECTRWRHAEAFPAVNEHWTEVFMSGLLRAFPFPVHGIQTDNGHEFTFNLLPGETRKHRLDSWCESHNITHRLIPPGVKELNGKVERSHRIDADYFYGNAPTGSLELFNKSLARWIRSYNLHRPHGGIGYMTPLEKLKERITSLASQSFCDDREAMRKKFVESVKIIEKEGDRKVAA